jgi:hypothetical protein
VLTPANDARATLSGLPVTLVTSSRISRRWASTQLLLTSTSAIPIAPMLKKRGATEHARETRGARAHLDRTTR